MESNQKENIVEEEVIEEDTIALSANSKLRKKLQSKQNMQSKQGTIKYSTRKRVCVIHETI